MTKGGGSPIPLSESESEAAQLWSVSMEVREVSTFSPEEAAQLEDGEEDPWGPPLDITFQPQHRHVVLVDSDQVVGHAGFLPIEVETDGTRLAGIGLGGVMIHRRHRGQAMGGHLVEETTKRMRATGRPLAMLFCGEPRLAFYRRLGWQQLTGTVTVDQEAGAVVMPLLTCWLSFNDDGVPPTGDLRLLGLPF
jgi:GNAT superfamily N-acetyltransferase